MILSPLHETERIELQAGPFDGERVRVLTRTKRLVLAPGPEVRQRHPGRRAVYRRTGPGRFEHVGTVHWRERAAAAGGGARR